MEVKSSRKPPRERGRIMAVNQRTAELRRNLCVPRRPARLVAPCTAQTKGRGGFSHHSSPPLRHWPD